MVTKTLQLKKPIGKTLVLAMLLLAVTISVLELMARLPLINAILPAPSIGTPHKKLDLNFSFLDRLIQEEGSVDCLFIGSSMVKASIDPEIISKTIAEMNGKKIRCFNFGVAGFTPMVAADLAEIMIRKYNPRILVWGVSPESFIEGAGRKAKDLFKSNPWYRYQMGKFNLQGWLTEHSKAFRYFLRFRIWLERPQLSRELTLRENGMSRYGFSRKNREQLLQPAPLGLPEENEIIPESQKLYFSQKAFSDLKKVAKHTSNTKIVLIEIPVHKSIKRIYKNNKNLRTSIRETILQFVTDENIPFIRSQHLELIPDDGWKNMNHMNVKGADIFSDWLGIQLAKEIL